MQAVTVRYAFAADGNVREFTGIPIPIRTVVQYRRAVCYYYRLSHWIAASALMDFSDAARGRTATHHEYSEPELRILSGRAPMLRLVTASAAIDQFPA